MSVRLSPIGTPITFFYLHTLLYIYAPWGFALMFAIFYDFKALFKKQLKPTGYYVLGGIWLFFIIISIAKGKSPNYLSALIPLFSVMLAKQLSNFFENPGSRLFKTISIIQLVTVVLLWVFIVLLVGYLFPIKKVFFYMVFAAGLALTIFIYRKANSDIAMKFFAPSILAVTLIMFSINANILPYILQFQSSIVASRIFNDIRIREMDSFTITITNNSNCFFMVRIGLFILLIPLN